MDLDLRTLTLRAEPTPVKGFFRLPWELRQRIYEECLIELPKWEKMHRADCFLVAKDTHTCEVPPFANRSMLNTYQIPECQCARRRGLGLLLANRQINREAAEVFWTRNVFCFTRAMQLGEDLVTTLRPAHRLMLRHVSVLLYQNDSVPNDNYRALHHKHVDDLWDALMQCNGLRTLEMYHGLLDKKLDRFQRLKTSLPQLQSFRLVSLLAYKVWPVREDDRRPANAASASASAAGSASTTTSAAAGLAIPVLAPAPAGAAAAAPLPPPPERYVELNPHVAGYDYCMIRDLSRVLWFKAGVTVDLATVVGAAPAYNVLRNYQTNFLVHLRHALARLPEAWARTQRRPQPLPPRRRDQALSSSSDSDSGRVTWDATHGTSRFSPEALRLAAGRLPPRLRDGPGAETLVLRDGTACPVQVLGLPVSKALRTRRFLERDRAKQLLRQEGRLTPEEAALQKEVAERRLAKAQSRAAAEEQRLAAAQRERADQKQVQEDDRRAEAKEAQAAERARRKQVREEVVAARLAARKRRVSGNEVDEDEEDEGSEADTEEEPRISSSSSPSSPSSRDRRRPTKGTPSKKKGSQGSQGRGARRTAAPRTARAYRPHADDFDD